MQLKSDLIFIKNNINNDKGNWVSRVIGVLKVNMNRNLNRKVGCELGFIGVEHQNLQCLNFFLILTEVWFSRKTMEMAMDIILCLICFFFPTLLVETGGHNFREWVMKWEEIEYQGGHVGTEKIKSQFGNIHMYILDGGLNWL